MSVPAALPLIRPITELRTQLNDICKEASEMQEPIVLTKNGVASYVFMDSRAYESIERGKRIYLALREAEIEERYRPETVSPRESNAKLREIFALWNLEYSSGETEE